jgi:hypothetical protein
MQMTRLNSIGNVIAGLIVLGVSVAALAPSAADALEFCDMYATKAVNQIDTAVMKRCNFTGPRWSPDKEMHRKWCLALNGDQTLPNSENEARDAEIEDCTVWCRNYGRQASYAAYENFRVLKCGYTGPRWSQDYEMHQNWCLFEGTQALANAENEARRVALKDCRVKALERVVPKPPEGAGDSLKEMNPPPKSVPKPPGWMKP